MTIPRTHQLMLALDHHFFGETTYLQQPSMLQLGLQLMLLENPDAVVICPGQAAVLQNITKRPKLLLRADLSNAYEPNPTEPLYCEPYEEIIQQAQALGASGIVASLLSCETQPQLEQQCFENLSNLSKSCHQIGIWLQIETWQIKADGDKYRLENQPKKPIDLIRNAMQFEPNGITIATTRDHQAPLFCPVPLWYRVARDAIKLADFQSNMVCGLPTFESPVYDKILSN
jgi:fructose-bisphosphate aldolase, class I